MKILVVSHFYPMPDRQADMLRFFYILKILSAVHEVYFFARDEAAQARLYGQEQTDSYRRDLEPLNIKAVQGSWGRIKEDRYDVVFFEHYLLAQHFLDDVRYLHPDARIIVDTVDVAHKRLFSKAQLSRERKDFVEAKKVKRTELTVYAKADVVVAISESDKAIMHAAKPHLAFEVIPLIYKIPELKLKLNSAGTLIFVGNFRYAANADAMIYFCRDVLPLIKGKAPHIKVTIVGNDPPEALGQFIDQGVHVLGHVPEVAPHYEASDICIAPLTWGGGLKGKVAEAMSYGLPVVTTSVGAEGFGLVSGETVMVGDSPEAFAEAVVRLHSDAALYAKIRAQAWQLVSEHYSEEQAARRISQLFDRLADRAKKRMPLSLSLQRKATEFLERHVLWRFKQS